MQINQLAPPAATAHPQPAPADRLEQAFLEEMLKYCGPQPGQGAFSGGAGEDQFASFLNREYAAIMARRMDLGFSAILPGAQG
ncbi:rod-binding protein [Paracoccus marinaquae]|uniref:Rod-binding protein n=1 Tax=Paracoccus marinaquae TaxID=2841926 RepID=A0ABS6AHU3_9RHOB|nr:rod-binding protein [Paracoccus marinaquae]MBU3029199.1 rod-binding protein [Paracoccus marinaquae]